MPKKIEPKDKSESRPDKHETFGHRLMHNSKWEECDTLQDAGKCLVWTGRVYHYGHIAVRGTDGKNKTLRVHRVAKIYTELLEINPSFDMYDPEHKEKFFDLYRAYGQVGLTIDHLCKNPLCINPDHLEWVWMDVNQKRKKWNSRQRSARVQKLQEKKVVFKAKTRISAQRDVSHLIRHILGLRTYRRKS